MTLFIPLICKIKTFLAGRYEGGTKTWLTALPLMPWPTERQGLWWPRARFKEGPGPYSHPLLRTLRRTSPLFNSSRVLPVAQSTTAQQRMDFGEHGVMQLLLPLPRWLHQIFHKNLLQIPALLARGNSVYSGEIILIWLKKIHLHHLVTLEQLTKGALWGGWVDVLLQLQRAAGWGCLQGRKYWEESEQ